jgi:hypothetical protein
MINEHGAIQLSAADVREGLRLERALAHAHDLTHAAQNDLNRFVAHLAALHAAPPGWQLTDWLRGFEPPAPDGGSTDG